MGVGLGLCQTLKNVNTCGRLTNTPPEKGDKNNYKFTVKIFNAQNGI